ncbi:signal peptidase I [Nocardioides piscis]|uniref:Signal peptidase I n=1 Tax=Nocardioides piscis TaxID=2714938 RepID=A0A6G7YFX8_9ACTN|nr:signal peptidase I [Nocardioides piscis]QIK75804.1 signal peptidase I [Nocardioides piscis]
MVVHQSRPVRLVTRASRLVVNLALGVVVLVAASFVVPGLLGFERYVIVGGSMSGTFERGSVAFERLVPVADLEVGDIITYQPPAESGLTTLVTHRIVAVRETRRGEHLFRTQGDANAQADPWTFSLPEGQQPRVDFTVPLVGHAFMAIADRETRMLLVGVPAGLVCLWGLGDLARLLVGLRRRQHAPHSSLTLQGA